MLLLRSWCFQEGVTLLAGKFNEDEQRGKLGEPSLSCRLLLAELQCRGVRLATAPSRAWSERSAPNVLALSKSRAPMASDSSRGWILRLWVSTLQTDPTALNSGYTCSTFALWWPKAIDVPREAAMRRSQDPSAEVSRDLPLFFLLLTSLSIKSQLRLGVPHADQRRLFPQVVSATVDTADMLSDVRSPPVAASEFLFCSSWPTTASTLLPYHIFGCDVAVNVAMVRCVSSASTGPAWLDPKNMQGSGFVEI